MLWYSLCPYPQFTVCALFIIGGKNFMVEPLADRLEPLDEAKGSVWVDASDKQSVLPCSAEGWDLQRELRSEVGDVMKWIRTQTPRLELSTEQAKGTEVWEANVHGLPTERVIIYLRSSGCFWAIKPRKNGEPIFRAGCLDCEHSVAETTFGLPVSADSYVQQFLGAYRAYDFSNYRVLCLYNEGNFFNNQELPTEARRKILEIIAADPNIEVVVVESLPQFITNQVLRETKDILANKCLEIGIGLESADPIVRSLCINKSFSLRRFEEVAALVNRYCRLLAYVLVKPSFLTEREAFHDAMKTVEYAFKAGAGVVSIEPISIREHSMAGVLARLGLYRTAWLWTVIEVSKAAYKLGEVRIGGYQFAPSYDYHAHNCEDCTPRVKQAIREFNSTNDIRLLDNLSCDCQLEWQIELQKEHRPLFDRVRDAVLRLRAYQEQIGNLGSSARWQNA
jgi:hypothetical protein